MTRPDSRPARSLIALGLLWAGRLLLLGTPILGVACYLYRETWNLSPVDSAGFSTHWLPNATIGAALLWSLLLPALVLPVASDVLATQEPTGIFISTVLGRRRITLPLSSVRRARLPGEGYGMGLVAIRGANRRLGILATSEAWGPGPVARAILVADRQRQRPKVLGVLGFVVWIPLALFLGSALAALAGAL